MVARCATLEEFLAVVPEFRTAGSTSGAQVNAGAFAIGDRFSVRSASDFPAVGITFTGVAAAPVLGTEYLASGTSSELIASLVASINFRGELITASVPGDSNIMWVQSIQTGVDGLHSISDKPSGAFTFPDGVTLQGGDALILQTLSCACSQINLACWGVKSDCAHIYLTAHMLSLAIGQESGPVSSRTIDKISESYAIAAATGSDAGLSSTPWGRLYAQLRRSLFVAPIAGRRFLGRF
tara:strand:- start:399 stop:1115 length:717 start_codon:yes stop_codon:yes gene_type:complete